MKLYVFSFSNGRDIIADASAYLTKTEGCTKFGDLYLPSVFTLDKPRILMMHPSPTGIRVGMAPANVEEPQDSNPMPFNFSELVYCYQISKEKGDLATNYVQSTTNIAIASSMPVAPSRASNPFKAG